MRSSLITQIMTFLDDSSDGFTEVALAVHRFQHARDPVVRALIDHPATTLEEIPAIPVGLFRDLEVGTVRAADPHVAFHTSGTTVGRHGVHRMVDTVLYDRGCMRHARAWLPQTRRTLGLLPDAPHSSLAHMVRGFAPSTGPVQFLQTGDELDTAPLREPVSTFVCATAFALDRWLAEGPDPLEKGSAIMVTGGFKGRHHTLDAKTLLLETQRLAPVVLEYGMTELSSQLWAHPGEPYRPPPWLRVTAVNPLTGNPVPSGEVGQLRFLDLCNLDATLHIETLDQGEVHADGRVTLLGRLEDAPARGCSLTAEDLR